MADALPSRAVWLTCVIVGFGSELVLGWEIVDRFSGSQEGEQRLTMIFHFAQLSFSCTILKHEPAMPIQPLQLQPRVAELSLQQASLAHAVCAYVAGYC